MRSGYMDPMTRSIVSLSPPEGNHLAGDGWVINRVSVLAPHRGKGLARKLMDEVIADADAEQVKLYLEVKPSRDGFGALSSDQLIAFYTRCGFKPGICFPIMVRTPQPKDNNG